MRHVAITGMYRSGTTLLHHLLDAHVELNVFPVENCVIRDTLFQHQLPHASKRSLEPLTQLITQGKYDVAIDYIISHEKLGLALTNNINLSGSTGQQNVPVTFDLSVFKQEMHAKIQALRGLCHRELVCKLFEMYHASYSAAASFESKVDAPILVNKCPDAGLMIDFLLESFNDIKVIHIVRDPRAVIASFKAALPLRIYHRPFRLISQLKLLRYSYSCVDRYAAEKRVLVVRYEDLVIDPEKVMAGVAKHIGIKMSDSLLFPTIRGVPWKSNSSNPSMVGSNIAINADFYKYRKKLNTMEIRFIEDYLRTEMAYLKYPFDWPFDVMFTRVRYLLLSMLHIPSYYFLIKRKLEIYLQKGRLIALLRQF